METIWIILIICMLLIGLVGTFVPALPCVAIGWAAMLILYLVSDDAISGSMMWRVTIAAVLVQLIDVVLPLWGVKILGGTKKGIRGATIGLMIAAIWSFSPLTFFIPGFLTIIAFPVIGAFAAEFIAEGGNVRKAVGAAAGSLVGFFLTVGFKFILIAWYLYLTVAYLVK